MLPIIAWRNVWRHKIRSLVVILSIAVGLWAGVFMVAFSWGMYRQYMREAIETQLSHLQLHHPEFEEQDRNVAYTLKQSDAVMNFLRHLDMVKAATPRVISTGMASSPTTASGINIKGIVPAEEAGVTGLPARIIEGKYLDTVSRNPVLVGEKLARKLKVKLKSKIILTFQDARGGIVAGAFRITGIYRSKNNTLDETEVYVQASDLGRLLGTGAAVHEIAILLHNDNAEPVKEMLDDAFPGVDIRTWKELSPELDLVINSFNEFMYIFVGFILLALTFGIVNTMLMAVLERVREIGILMAIGISRMRVFAMVMLETLYLALAGGPLGLLIGYVTIHWTGKYGIDISIFSEGLSAYGFSSMVYPELAPGYYLPITLMTIITALLSAIYPAIRAVKLRPSEAIRKI